MIFHLLLFYFKIRLNKQNKNAKTCQKFWSFKMTNDFFKFEDKEYDLPFLNGDSRFTTKNVAILLIGFLIAAITPFIIPPTGNEFLKSVIVTFAPLLTVVYVFKNDMSNIIRKPKLKDILIVVIGLIMMVVLDYVSASIISVLGLHALTDSAVNGSPISMIIRLLIQLWGEELVKFIPLIIVTAYLYKSIGRKAAIIVAIIISQIIFSLIHIPAYGFSILFLLIGIGLDSIALPLVYIRTKNLALCYLVHLIYDLWTIIPYYMNT